MPGIGAWGEVGEVHYLPFFHGIQKHGLVHALVTELYIVNVMAVGRWSFFRGTRDQVGRRIWILNNRWRRRSRSRCSGVRDAIEHQLTPQADFPGLNIGKEARDWHLSG